MMLVVTVTYLGNLTAFLAVVRVDPPFNSLEELVNQDEYTFGVQGNTGYETVLKVGLFSFALGGTIILLENL